MWPTPHTTCHTGPGEHGQGGQNLQTVVDGKEYIFGGPGETYPSATQPGQLNSDWCECLMSLPIEPQEWPGWPAPLGANMWRTPDAWMGARGTNTIDGYQNCVNTNESSVKLNDQAKFEETGQYPYEPTRVITGQKNRAKRLKCVGNSVCPLQAAPIFAAIAEIERRLTRQ
jgi:hypothetical protein